MKQTQFVGLRDFVDARPVTTEDFVIGSVEVPELKDGEVLLELVNLSVDPYMRGRMRNVKSYFSAPFQPGEPITSHAIARVRQSKAEAIPEGAYVSGVYPWKQIQAVPAASVPLHQDGVAALDESFLGSLGLPPSVYLDALGMTGMTADTSLVRIGQPKAGETVFVSAAAGAVGLVVGQLCKHVFGCTVIGSAGSDEKVSQLPQYGYDSVFNYKKEKTSEALARLAPKGIDIYYDNVGGETLEAALDVMNTHGRVVACGSISGYDTPASERYGVKNLFNVVTKQLKFEGFLVGQYADMRDEFESSMKQYLREGKVRHVEHVVAGGLPQAGSAFVEMMAGGNLGKTMVQCGDDPLRGREAPAGPLP